MSFGFPLIEMFNGRTKGQWAHRAAHLFAPSLILAFGLSGLHYRGLIFDLTGPVYVTELQTQVDADGQLTTKHGVAVTLDSLPAESRLSVVNMTGRAWSSLDAETWKANRDHLKLTDEGLISRTPLLGVSGATTLIIEGQLGNRVDVAGGKVPMDDWKLPEGRVMSVLSSVLLACVFALGMALNSGGQRTVPNQKTTRQITTQPDKD